MTARHRVAGIVLAAGAARRFGGGKLLADLRGQPLAAWSFDAARRAVLVDALECAVAVVPAGDAALAALARAAGLEPVAAPAAPPALGLSIRAGLAALAALPSPPDAAMFLLADQPGIRAPVIAAVAAAARAHPADVLRARYAGAATEPGHPVVLPRAQWPLAAALAGDEGVGAVLRAAGLVPRYLDLPGTNPDIDTPADLAAWTSKEPA